MASLEHGVALSPRSVLDVGSISKQFTAMAILMLQKEGKLSLDDPIRKYIPEMPGVRGPHHAPPRAEPDERAA